MNKKNKIIILGSILLIILIVVGILFSIQVMYKINNQTIDEIIEVSEAQTEIKIGEESTIYVDLTESTSQLESELITRYEEAVQLAENSEEQEIFDQINQEYFDFEFDLDAGVAIVDNEQIDIAEFLEITEDEKEELLSSEEKFYNYLSENLSGDLEYEDGTIKVDNPYSTNTIMIETSKLEQIESGGNIKSIVKVAEDIYCVHYENALDTKEGYNILQNDENISTICKDAKINFVENVQENENSTISTLGVTEGKEAWGTVATGLDLYTTKVSLATKKAEVKVAVIDSGIRATHEIFANETTGDRIDTTYSYNFASDNTDVTDDNGHGTMVAGIIAQSTSNNVKVVPVKIIDSFADLLEAITHISNYVDIINISMGLDEKYDSESAIQLGEQTLKNAYDNGKIIVCAAGNDGKENVIYPARSEYTIAVSAVDAENNIASFSNYGSEIDFTAPGNGLCLPYYTGDNLYNMDFTSDSLEYKRNSGTSFSAPFVAAATAMIKSENPDYTIEQVKSALIENSEDLGESGKDKYYGYGIISFNKKMFAKPVIARVDTTNQWAEENTIKAFAVCSNPIESWTYSISQTQPQDADWIEFTSPSTVNNMILTVSENGDYYIWFKDENGNTMSQVVTIQYVDNTVPIVTTQITTTNITSNGFVAKLSAQDTQSGLAKVDWYYKKSTDTEYAKVTDTYATEGTGETTNVEKRHQFANLQNNETYNVYAKIYDIVGNVTTTNEITINTLIEDDNPGTNTNTNTSGEPGGNTNTNTSGEPGGNTNTNTSGEPGGNTNTNTSGEPGGNTNTNTSGEPGGNTNTNTSGESGGNTNTNTSEVPAANTNTNTSVAQNTNNNSSIGFTNNNQKNTTLNSVSAKMDNSTSSKALPKTGINRIIILTVVIVFIGGIFTYIRYKNLKEIK